VAENPFPSGDCCTSGKEFSCFMKTLSFITEFTKSGLLHCPGPAESVTDLVSL
jgi:hypothetical protein